MKISSIQKVTGALSAFAVVACMVFMSGGQAFALTQVSDWAYEDYGLPLSYCSGMSGTTVLFGDSCNFTWQAELALTTVQGSKYYYWHPYDDTTTCLTASTSQKGVLKLETCDGPSTSQQLWYNPNSGGNYHLESDWYDDECLYEAGGMQGTGTNFTTDCTYGENGQTFTQTP